MGGEPRGIGPVPEGADPDAYDRLRRRILWSMPSGLYVLGTRGVCTQGTGSTPGVGRRNLMTLNWATQVAVDPKLLAVSVEAGAVSHGLLRDGRVFSLNILPREHRALVRRFVKPLDDGGEPSQLAGMELRQSATGAPILAAAAAWLECEVRHELPCGSHTLFVGAVVGCGGEPDGLEVLRMEDTRMSYGG